MLTTQSNQAADTAAMPEQERLKQIKAQVKKRLKATDDIEIDKKGVVSQVIRKSEIDKLFPDAEVQIGKANGVSDPVVGKRMIGIVYKDQVFKQVGKLSS